MVTLVILTIMIIGFIGGWLRADLVALLGLLLLVLTNQLTPVEAMAGFSNSVVLMIAGLFIVGAGLFHTGLAERLGAALIPYAKGSEVRLFLVLMVTVTLLSSLMSNTGTVALLIPVVLAMSRQIGTSPAKLLMPLAFFSSIGGTMTLIGTPPNLVAAETLRNTSAGTLGFFALFPIGLVMAVVGLLYFHVIGNRLLGTNEVRPSAMHRSAVPHISLFAFILSKGHPLIGRTIRDVNWSRDGLIVVGEQEKSVTHRFVTARAETRLIEGKVYVSGAEADVRRIARREGVAVEQVDLKAVYGKAGGVAVFTIPTDSPLVGRCLSDSHLRNEYRLNVLQVIRPNEEIALTRLKDVPLERGDMLVAQGEWDDLERAGDETALLLANERVTDVANRAVSERHQLAAGLIMLMMIALLVFEWVDPTVAVWLAALAMVLTGAVRHMDVAYESIQWSSLLLIAAMIPVGQALDNAGIMSWLVTWISDSFGQAGPVLVLVAIFLATMALSQIISNTATAVLFAPLAVSLAAALHVSPVPLVVAVAIAASLAFMTPFGSPTNAMVFGIGGYRFFDFVKVGLPLQVVTAVIAIFTILLLFPF
ncbi:MULTISPECIES: SLC13 family permease [Exiguobacterium]|uniref:SLC13 family permease n=1 Tax=Exiguobacterium TaxID=33986 RepID=UPI0020358590|nr:MULTISPECIES: SLC13 family permease [Exiguobacterium]MCT4778050.1 SLC13 family permease [Exiguobacterium aquaticum]MCT4790093.1 SLC13 family permease [Exiguobacterium mexicanum]